MGQIYIFCLSKVDSIAIYFKKKCTNPCFRDTKLLLFFLKKKSKKIESQKKIPTLVTSWVLGFSFLRLEYSYSSLFLCPYPICNRN